MTTMRAGVLTIAVALLAALAGCGSESTVEGGGGGSGAGGGKLAAQLEFSRGGGIAGRMDKLVIQPDGSAMLTTRLRGERPIELTGKQLDEVAVKLADADLPSQPKRAISDPAQPDAFGYTVEYQGKRVTADEGAMPDELSALMGTLGGLVDRNDRR